VKEEDIELSLNGNLLTVSGKREVEKREEGDQYFSVERSFGTFSRSFSLPDNVDVDHISADLRNGVLTAQIPKKPEAQPKKISIGKRSSSDGGQAKA
jgi:HSP20 family protein